MTNQSITFEVLNGHFEDNHGNIDKKYFLDAIDMHACNTRYLWDEIVHTNRKMYAVVWQCALDYVNFEIRCAYSSKYTCTSEQLKKWLKLHGLDYKTAFIDLIADMTKERERIQAEDKEEV